MSVRVKIAPLDRNVELAFRRDLTPQAQSEVFAETARAGLAEAEAQNARALGSVPPHETFVDGRAEAPLESVRPDGTIVFVFKLVTEALAFIFEMLETHSPIKTGRYERSHLFFADDVEADPVSPPPATEYVFVNSQPYARKIELGESPEAPEGVYEGIATMAQGRFGNIAKVRFEYREPIGETELHAWSRRRQSRRHESRVAIARDTRQPAIVVRTY